ncbi:MAG TPA: hypothetical protein VJQ08_01630 [Candidatus Dormibacteraeota bacterium]|nr:hypothetical protein [Candidatus Dormibacteraeota bacterium]
MVWLASILLYLHILGAIFWVGSAMMFQFIFVPALKGMPFEAQHPWLQALAARYGPVVGVAGGLTMLLGLARGVSTGVLGTLSSPYGVTWLVAILVGLPVVALGAAFIGPTDNKMATAGTKEEVVTLATRMSRFGRAEFGGMVFLLALMVAMHAGY